VFQNLGDPVLQGAFEGYNGCIFAYGQTGRWWNYNLKYHEKKCMLVYSFTRKFVVLNKSNAKQTKRKMCKISVPVLFVCLFSICDH
jgi:hypothetical protein